MASQKTAEIPMPQPKSSAKTHTGNVRAGNEDCFFCDDDLGLWLVADGMGGHEAGEVASAITAQVIEEEIRKGSGLANAIQKSHRDILAAAERGQGARGMGSTVVAIRQDTLGQWELGWVGDSRAYLWSQLNEAEGELQQLSRDHSYVQALFDSGAITEAEMDNHPERNVITQCLGSLEIPIVRVDSSRGEWKAGQKILLCSDGMSDEVNDSEIANILNEYQDRDMALDKLLETALKNGGRDNVSIVLIEAPAAEAAASVIAPPSSTPTTPLATTPATQTVSKSKILIEIASAIAAAILLAALLIHFFG
jgi:protein phosphatase